MKQIVLKLELHDDHKAKRKALKTVATLRGIDSIAVDINENKLTVVGNVDPISVVSKLRKHWPTTDIILVAPVVEPEIENKEDAKKEDDPKDAPKEEEPKKEDEEVKKEEQEKEEEKKHALFLELVRAHRGYNHQMPTYYYPQSMEENPNACTVC